MKQTNMIASMGEIYLYFVNILFNFFTNILRTKNNENKLLGLKKNAQNIFL